MLDIPPQALLESPGRVCPTLPSLTEDEIFSIWGSVSEFVERQLGKHKGVRIPGLGTFTLQRQKIELGNRFLLLQRPVFILSEKFAQIFRLQQSKVYVTGDIPVVPLNFSAISLEGPFHRDVVEGCVRETLLFFSRSVATKQSVEFTFKGIGVLAVRAGKAKMRFYREFLSAMDGSGNLVKALSNRPGTADSVASGRDGPGAGRSGSIVTFPRKNPEIGLVSRLELKEAEGKPAMVTITEENEAGGTDKMKPQEPVDDGTERASSKKLQTRPPVSPPKVPPGNRPDEAEKPRAGEKNCPSESPHRSPSPAAPKAETDSSPARPKTSAVPVCQDHLRAGQEMCYLCMQRAQRNVPVYLSEERKRKDTEEMRILQQYQALRDQEALHKHQMQSLAIREQNQKNAAFNLGIAEAIRSHKQEKPEFSKSFVFPRRPPSAPLNSQRRQEYARGLLTQLEEKRERDTKSRQNKAIMEHLEQVQLAEELAAQRAKYLRDKMEEVQCYRRALDTQIKNRPAPLPPCEPGSSQSIFGKWSQSTEHMAEIRQRERDFFEHQLRVATECKRAALLSRLQDRRREVDMLRRSKNEYLADRDAELERLHRTRLDLQDHWGKSAEMKRQHDCDQRAFDRSMDKVFILDQCKRYRRCCQCKRGLANCGSSNLWPLTKQQPGSRLLV
ncbi:coiled-coil domain-containing protein 81 isoform X2 [Tachyglossus aculeatus]|uniref:coiled-coil domain-containing protein 81 isoform X2 n=1 Tax=Tachyglossus aculeatus TaxID=9261 RepID=UPI0018F6EF32|nr:coiled-coil domain-containing protein 81 isoform X2 [Tachyglossus aculeatus]